MNVEYFLGSSEHQNLAFNEVLSMGVTAINPKCKIDIKDKHRIGASAIRFLALAGKASNCFDGMNTLSYYTQCEIERIANCTNQEAAKGLVTDLYTAKINAYSQYISKIVSSLSNGDINDLLNGKYGSVYDSVLAFLVDVDFIEYDHLGQLSLTGDSLDCNNKKIARSINQYSKYFN